MAFLSSQGVKYWVSLKMRYRATTSKSFNNELIKQIFKFYKNNESFNDEP